MAENTTGQTAKTIAVNKILVKLEKKEIEDLISEKSDRVTFLDKLETGKVKSKVWENFKIVEIDKVNSEYAICENCRSLIPCKNSCTTSLIRHHCKPTAKQIKIDQFVPNVSNSQITTLNKKIAIGLAVDMRPLSTVQNAGFRMIAQELINFGARNGFVNVNSALMHRKTLTSYLPGLVEEKRTSLKLEMVLCPSYPKLAWTTDMWSDSYQQRNFLSFICHYLNSNFELKVALISVEEFPDVCKSAANIKLECERLLLPYFGDQSKYLLKQSFVVTDGGQNIANAFSKRLPCLCHRLSLLVHWMFNEKSQSEKRPNDKKNFQFQHECPNMRNSILSVKELVAFFKRSGLNKKLKDAKKGTLKQEVCTRWNSTLIMLESYIDVTDEVKRILMEKNQLDKILTINDDLIKELVGFLQLFKECTEAWSKETAPTIHDVVPWIHRLEKHLNVLENDSIELGKLKLQAKVCFDEYLNVDDIYYVACVFHPRRKTLKFLDDDKRNKVYFTLRCWITEEQKRQEMELVPRAVNTKVPSTSKKPRFDDLEDSSSDSEQEDTSTHELDIYLASKFKSDENVDLLKFWKNANDFPTMRSIAAWLLAIPASQTSDERAFSTTGATLTPKRTDLKASNLSDLTFINKNYQI